ncbi:xanthine dehydrogenase family protein molybdopterin-binding subunit [Clostridium sp. HMP27]|uniref:xanthine dehydrogenase family protein molybdopterin-binding subunit n=1 Tax=Clostridium sp. HMP27 TaxID=1487921 RepID=UPI00052C5AB5|nr:xanthine dehydrogenase family protein molybdopterin-binding subunit [Clostridium sp. HMP27]KGK85018.1 aldehyde oxidase [Clostridium sp. HMP27]
MKCISESIKRFDTEDKISGKAKYIGDYKFHNMLYAKTLRSTEPRAKIKSIKYPEFPEGYYVVDKDDVPGENGVKIITYEEPFFAKDIVNYVGEPISLIVGPDKSIISDIISNTKVNYEALDPILTLEESLECKKESMYKDNNCFVEFEYSKGNLGKVKKNASYVIEGEYETGYQEQLYLEPQGVIGTYKDGKVTVYGSIQCPYYVKNALIDALKLPEDKVQIVQATTGGAFGGKEDYPSLIGGHVAFAALKTKKPVQLIFDRNEDLECTPKRHPSKIKIKSYLDQNYMIIGREADISLDGGAYEGLSSVVLQRTMFAVIGVYNVENVNVKGRVMATNTVVTGAFRGFGAPQAFFAEEMHMEHIAKKLGIDSLEFKLKNMVKQGDKSSTGGVFRDKIRMPEMVERAIQMSGYKDKKQVFKNNKKDGKLNGIGISLFFHGGGFTGSGERDHIKAKVKLVRYPDNKVEILIANVEMGQGTQTALRKIVAHTLNVPVNTIIYENPDTDRVPDSGPTVASRTTVVVGKLLEEAASKLKARWNEEGQIETEANYKFPEIYSWDGDNFIGDAYNSYSWGVNVVEVEVDSLTYLPDIKGVWSVFDIGCAIDERIVRGQIEGGMLQGLGYGGIEVMESRNGRIMQKTSSDYTIPTIKDAPKIENELICEPYFNGPFGAKGLGELTLIGAAPAYALAIQDAIDKNIYKIPVRPEHLMGVMENEQN